jgi:hypothetical protein
MAKENTSIDALQLKSLFFVGFANVHKDRS